MFGLQIIDQDTRVVHVREMTHSHVNPSNVTGREHDQNEIVKLLVQDVHHQTLSVVPIVGMGGLGKTTLAKLVFNDTNIDACFPLKMWVCVSNDFELRNVLNKIINSVPNPTSENNSNFETGQLQNHLRNTLQGQKFLLVLDDVWNEDRVRWDELKEIIDSEVEGNKILVTTRSHEIANMMRTRFSNFYLLECLSEEDSLSLFLKCAFEDGDEKKHPQLLEIGKEIVKKCGGLPLALKTVRSSLFSRVDKKEWESIRDNEIWNLKQNEKFIFPALKLSYDQLPSYLKPCFASFSLYPQDIDISCSQISTMWGALGFLPPLKESESMTDVANQLVHELWSRSFLSEYIDLGSDSSFQLHDLVHDLATYIAKGEFERIDLPNPKIFENVQHLAFMDNNLLAQAFPFTSLRSLCFHVGMNNEALLNTFLSRCKYLRVLQLCLSEYESLPDCIGKLKHLRCLNLQNSEKLEELHDSVCKLQNLQTLNLFGCIKLQKLPKGIKNLISLRNLIITTRQLDLPEEEIASLSSLENLYFRHCHNLESLFEGILLPNLTRLSLYDCKSLKSMSFHAITNLKFLNISQCDKLELLMGLGNQIPDLRLKSLILVNLPQLVTLPEWFQRSAKSLETLFIAGCINLEELPDWLTTLICLKELDIWDCPNLLSLPDNMYHLTNLEELPDWLTTLICLKELDIWDCPNLLSLPDNMYHLTNLEEIEINGCPELCRRLKPKVGPDWHQISHIKNVYIDESENEEEFS
ncbi:hypothetical protein PHAVU_007G254400 [Phaseolus vulgaris]|uniref:Uncharacterized protein n=1 Tax=Phaseolus vulgaris TaxID=3885 RepID=V7BM02_PHAVU|nr:hypothetical protein PHAVU_007G254400g [Phaseolus vulgaris]ESW17616.1 hypothetical protein PHAVU_007G254400g [Phaseolus vulgaris]